MSSRRIIANTAGGAVRKRRTRKPAVSVTVNRNSGARRSRRPSAHAAVNGPATTRLNAAIDRTSPISAPRSREPSPATAGGTGSGSRSRRKTGRRARSSGRRATCRHHALSLCKRRGRGHPSLRRNGSTPLVAGGGWREHAAGAITPQHLWGETTVPMPELFDLTGQTALITGSSRGIGKAIAHRMAEHGANVIVSSRKGDACDAAVAEINAAVGREAAVAIPANIAYKASLQALVDKTIARFGRIDASSATRRRTPITGRRRGSATISSARSCRTTSCRTTG